MPTVATKVDGSAPCRGEGTTLLSVNREKLVNAAQHFITAPAVARLAHVTACGYCSYG